MGSKMSSPTSVYTVDGSEDVYVTEIKNTLYQCDNGNNPDLAVVFKGYLHNKSGFKFRVENLEHFQAVLFDDWKHEIGKNGMVCDINADLSNSWVDITCKKILRQRRPLREKLKSLNFFPTMSSIPLSVIVYITLSLSAIYILWRRHQEKFIK